MSDYSDEVLSVWLDGELEPAQADAIVRDVKSDPALANRIAAMTSGDEALRAAFDAELGDVPDSLKRAIGGGSKVLAFRPRSAPARTPHAWPRIAASGLIALAVGAAAVGLLIRPSGQASNLVTAARGGLTAGTALASALGNAHSGENTKVGIDVFRVSASFRATDNRYCREFHIDFAKGGADAVACRDASGWQIEGWTAAPMKSTSYETAGGPDNAALNAVIDRLGTRTMLDRAGEDSAIRTGWK